MKYESVKITSVGICVTSYIATCEFNIFHSWLIVLCTGILEIIQMSQDAEKGPEREGQGEEERQKGKEKEAMTSFQ